MMRAAHNMSLSPRWMVAGIILFAGGLAPAADRNTVAAKVGNDTISIGEVHHEMKIALGERKLAEDEREVLQAQTLGLLANRQLVIQYLRKMKLGASEQEIDAEVDRLAAQLKRQDKTLDAFLKSEDFTKAEL